MVLKAIIDDLGLEVKPTGANLSVEVTGAYVSDLLSDVMANAGEHELWITLQIHPNIVAVAVLKELAGIILVNNRQPEEETLKKAEQEGIPILVSKLTAFVLAGRLFKLFG
jgi:serine kinase of HPr protein (carbohydrate metabolism regulator)